MVHTTEGELIASYLTSHIEGQRWSEREAATRLGLTRSTLRRRLSHGDFRVNELAVIATRLDTTSAELVAKARAGVAA